MASGIFALLDDIGALMDDVASAAKVATKKTAGILGDDLAVNAEKSTGFVSSRELPVLWAITKDSFLNKLIIIPAVFILNVYLPIAITIILMVGGAYLAYEGVEKIIEFLFHRKQQKPEIRPIEEGKRDKELEKLKINDAVRTDFILSVEIIIIALSTVLDQDLWLRIAAVSVVAVIATVGVYGVVALIVRMDDIGYKLIKKTQGEGFLGWFGQLLVNSLPVIIRILSVVGTIALLLVSGGLFLHNIPFLKKFETAAPELLVSLVLGLIAGLITFLLVWGVRKLLTLFRN